MTEQQIIEAWQKVATPGAEHALLAKYTGNWKVTVKSWMNPKEPPTESTGKSRISMLLDGRVRTEDFQGNMGGMPFTGWGMLGYDNQTHKYWMTWNDTMSTALFYGEGVSSGNGKVITLDGYMNMPSQEGMSKVSTRNVYRLVDDDHFVLEGWRDYGTPQEAQMMEIRYSRK